MSIQIDREKCHGCPQRQEGKCERICPGNLIKRNNGKAQIDKAGECWDCAACVKACPAKAISLYLPEEIGGKGGEMLVDIKKDEIIWEFKNVKNGNKKCIISK